MGKADHHLRLRESKVCTAGRGGGGGAWGRRTTTLGLEKVRFVRQETFLILAENSFIPDSPNRFILHDVLDPPLTFVPKPTASPYSQ